MMDIFEIAHPTPRAQLEDISAAFASAFGRSPASDFAERLNEKRRLMILIAGSDPVRGFKIGYERFRGVFFSWLGGVRAEFQGQGIARMLLRHQHRLCAERGYHQIQTETFADGKAMLLLNLSEGFEIFGTYLGDDGRLRVQLRKDIQAPTSEQPHAASQAEQAW